MGLPEQQLSLQQKIVEAWLGSRLLPVGAVKWCVLA